MIIKLDDVDIDFIESILDILDYYELYKLSLILCNRYNLQDRIAKYIMQLSMKYSNLDRFRFDLEKSKVQSKLN